MPHRGGATGRRGHVAMSRAWCAWAGPSTIQSAASCLVGVRAGRRPAGALVHSNPAGVSSFPMFNPRRAPVWIAALAMLLHLVMMPLMRGSAPMPGMAGHCPVTETSRQAVQALALHEHLAGHGSHAAPGGETPAPAHHSDMPCCCAAGSLVAIPGNAPALNPPRLARSCAVAPALSPPLSPRHRWPSLNPRASPYA